MSINGPCSSHQYEQVSFADGIAETRHNIEDAKNLVMRKAIAHVWDQFDLTLLDAEKIHLVIYLQTRLENSSPVLIRIQKRFGWELATQLNAHYL